MKVEYPAPHSRRWQVAISIYRGYIASVEQLEKIARLTATIQRSGATLTLCPYQMNDEKTRVAGKQHPTQPSEKPPNPQVEERATSSTENGQELEPAGSAQIQPEAPSASPLSVSPPTADTSQPGVQTPSTFTLPTQVGDPSQSKPLQSGSVLKERFVLEEMLGRGGMGVVFKARDLRKIEAMDRDPYIAVKVLSNEFQRNPDSFVALQREAKKAQQLAHPNIVTVFDFDRDGSDVFMTMELLEGEPLDQVIRRLRPESLPMDEAINIIQQMGRALAYAHEKKIVHSDFKPGNIFLTSKNVVKVVDFGIARAAQKPDMVPSDATIFDPGSLGALTPAYASCEMLEHGSPDPRDDVYGLAVVAYELLTGRHPFDRKTATYARDIDLKPKRPKEWPRHIWSAISNALQFEREKRTPDASRFLQEFSSARKERTPSPSKWLVYGTVGVVLTLAGIGTLLYLEPAIIDPAEAPITLEDTSQLDPQVRQKVENLLEVAEVHEMVARFLEPPGSNAYAAYQQVLMLHDNNRQARLGLQRIGDHLTNIARSELREGDIETSRSIVERGIAAIPTHRGLIEMQRELENH